MEETDMCLDAIGNSTFSHQQTVTCWPARELQPQQRQDLAVQALAGRHSITLLAQDHSVSRKFVHQQVGKAQQALHGAFFPSEPTSADVLFWLPVTKSWLKQLILCLILSCHSSLRGVVELLRDLFDYSISLGTVHDILQEAVQGARCYNSAQDLSDIHIGALDEIFQSRQPVFVGADVASTYCFLLSLEEHRDTETWAIRLLELEDQGFHPDATIADFGAALRAGQTEAFPGVPCRGDVFHLLREFQLVATYFDNRAYEAITTRGRLEYEQAQFQHRHGRPDAKRSQRIRHARPAEAQAIDLADSVNLLLRWLRQDILTVAGPQITTRRVLYDFIVAELQAREHHCPNRLIPICRLLKKQRDTLLAFAEQLDLDLAALAQEWQVPETLARELMQVQALEPHRSQRWQRDAALHRQLGARYHPLSQAIQELARNTVRASSVIENLNSRLRNYFFLRRHLGPDYLALLQFFLNHRRFLRSERPERVGKSPAELLTGRPHPHWLEMLGHIRWSNN
jgi:hypothetical protein